MLYRNWLSPSCAIGAALMLCGPASAQESATWEYTCQDAGAPSQPESLGDKEGHSISVGRYSCRAGPGPQAGGVMTGTNIWEWNGPNAVLLSDEGVVRKRGATIVYKTTEGKTSLTMTDGKVTGWTASGSGVDILGTGDWASMNGKRFHWTAKSVGPGSQAIVESTNE